MSRIAIVVIVAVLVLALGVWLRQRASTAEPSAEEDGGGTVDVRIEKMIVVPAENADRVTGVVVHGSGDQACRFTVALTLKHPQGDDRFSFGTGQFQRVADSKGARFLAELAAVLEGKLPDTWSKRDTVDFSLALLGRNMSRGTGNSMAAGGFTSDRPGPWTATKLFLGEDQDEVFFNFNSDTGEAEFSIKDPEYGDGIVRELATLF